MQKKGVRLVFEMIAVKPPGDPNHSMHNPGYRSLHYGNQSLQQQLPRASYSRFACPPAAKPVCCQAGYCFERLVYQQRCHPCSIPGLRRYGSYSKSQVYGEMCRRLLHRIQQHVPESQRAIDAS